jgi:hypothetical protein
MKDGILSTLTHLDESRQFASLVTLTTDKAAVIKFEVAEGGVNAGQNNL